MDQKIARGKKENKTKTKIKLVKAGLGGGWEWVAELLFLLFVILA